MAGDWIRAWRFDSLGAHCFKLAFDTDHKAECEVGEQKPVARKQKFSDKLLGSNSYGDLIRLLDLLFVLGIAWKQRDSNSKKESALERAQWRHPDQLTKAGTQAITFWAFLLSRVDMCWRAMTIRCDYPLPTSLSQMEIFFLIQLFYTWNSWRVTLLITLYEFQVYNFMTSVSIVCSPPEV